MKKSIGFTSLASGIIGSMKYDEPIEITDPYAEKRKRVMDVLTQIGDDIERTKMVRDACFIPKQGHLKLGGYKFRSKKK